MKGKSLSILILVLISKLMLQSSVSADSWTPKASMPTAREDLAAAVVDSKIYAIGGHASGTVFATNEEYDPLTNSWATKASMPTNRFALGADAVSGKIYAIGGGVNITKNEEYEPSTDTWTTKAPMPTRRGYLGVVAVNGKIYAIGGMGMGREPLATNEEYDPSTDTWTNKTSMPTARSALAVTVVGNKIYAVGGSAGGGVHLATNEEYDPITDTWSTKASMPTRRDGLAAATAYGKIYAIGGGTGGGVCVATNEEYDPVTDTWATKGSMPSKRWYLTAATVNNKIYAVGGWDPYGAGYLKANEEYTPDLPKVIVSVEPDTIIGPPPDIGDTFTDSICIADACSLYCWQFELNFNPAVLHAICVDEGPFLSQGGITLFMYDISDSSIHVSCTLEGSVPGVSGNGTMAYVTWQVIGYGSSILDLEAVVDSCESVDGYFYLQEPRIEEKVYSHLNKLKLQNYPNPFSQFTSIRYQVSSSGRVSLKVYDLAGRLIEVLVDDANHCGTHTLAWTPKGFSSGLYFLRLEFYPFSGEYEQVSNLVATNRVVILK